MLVDLPLWLLATTLAGPSIVAVLALFLVLCLAKRPATGSQEARPSVELLLDTTAQQMRLWREEHAQVASLLRAVPETSDVAVAMSRRATELYLSALEATFSSRVASWSYALDVLRRAHEEQARQPFSETAAGVIAALEAQIIDLRSLAEEASADIEKFLAQHAPSYHAIG